MGRVIIPASSINAETIVMPASRLFHTEGNDFFARTTARSTCNRGHPGDVAARLLRAGQAIRPFLRVLSEDRDAGRAVIERNAKNVLIDPYANAFTAGYKVWEEKWEVDSLDYPFSLAYTYWRRSGDRGMFTQRLHWALEHTMRTLRCEQHHATCSHYTTKFLPNGGRGEACAERA